MPVSRKISIPIILVLLFVILFTIYAVDGSIVSESGKPIGHENTSDVTDSSNVSAVKPDISGNSEDSITGNDVNKSSDDNKKNKTTSIVIDQVVNNTYNSMQATFDSALKEAESAAVEKAEKDAYVFVMPAKSSVIGTFVCERLGINEKLYYGDSDFCLHFGIGLSPYSELPGFGKPSLISGHNLTFFAPLEYVQVGDHFTINLDWGKYVYEVYSIEVKTPAQFDALFLARHSTDIVVYTCYPFLGQTGSTERMFLYCHMLEGKNMLGVN